MGGLGRPDTIVGRGWLGWGCVWFGPILSVAIGGTWQAADGLGKTLSRSVAGLLVALLDRGFEAGMDITSVEVIDWVDGANAPPWAVGQSCSRPSRGDCAGQRRRDVRLAERFVAGCWRLAACILAME